MSRKHINSYTLTQSIDDVCCVSCAFKQFCMIFNHCFDTNSNVRQSGLTTLILLILFENSHEAPSKKSIMMKWWHDKFSSQKMKQPVKVWRKKIKYAESYLIFSIHSIVEYKKPETRPNSVLCIEPSSSLQHFVSSLHFCRPRVAGDAVLHVHSRNLSTNSARYSSPADPIDLFYQKKQLCSVISKLFSKQCLL